MYTWKYHKEMPYVVTFNKQKCHFFLFKIGEQEGKTGSIWGLVLVEGGRMWGKDVRG
jgi:hypothetical protein